MTPKEVNKDSRLRVKVKAMNRGIGMHSPPGRIFVQNRLLVVGAKLHVRLFNKFYRLEPLCGLENFPKCLLFWL